MLVNNAVSPYDGPRFTKLPHSSLGGNAVSNNIIDIRSDEGDDFLLNSLRKGIRDASSGQGSFPDLLLWDKQGLRYFEDITYSKDYYLTNEEIEILRNASRDIAKHVQSGSVLVELGSGNLRKIKILLEALDELGRDVDYFALDVSFSELQRTLSLVPQGTFRHVRCFGLLGTYDDGKRWLQRPELQEAPKVILSLGSTLGSFARKEAAKLLASFNSHHQWRSDQRMSNSLQHDNHHDESDPSFIIGLDACEDGKRIHAAYSDPAGVNRRFVKHGLERANTIFGYDAFKLTEWDVCTQWDEHNKCNDQFYYPLKDVEVEGYQIPSGTKILVVQSHKYGEHERDLLWQSSGLTEVGRWTSSSGQYNLHFLQPHPH